MWRVRSTFLLLLAACAQPLYDDYPYLQPEADPAFFGIERLDPERDSRTPPVTPEDATSADEEWRVRKPPPESVAMSIEEVRRASLANNLDLKAQVVGPEITRATVDEERAKFEKAFFTTARGDVDDVSSVPPPGESRTSTVDVEPGVRIPLKTGGTAVVSLPQSFFETDPRGAPSADVYETALAFSISQPLLRDAGVEVNTASIQIARLLNRQEEARTKLTTIRVLADAERAYWNLYAAAGVVDVRHDQYLRALQQVEQARRLVAGGVVAEIEITRAESGAARRLEAVIVSETLRRRAERNLKRILNREDLPLGGPTTVRPETLPRPLGLDLDRDALADFAVGNRMELLELELQLAVDAVTVAVERNARLPAFALDFNYSFRGVGGNYADAFDNWSFNTWGVGLTLDVPLGNEAAKARYRRAVLQRAQTLATKAARELAIRQEVLDALDQLDQDWQRVLAARQETIFAARTYEAEQKQFLGGVRTSTDVLEALDFLADARSREVRALAAFQRSLVEIAFATGTVLGHGRIQWPTVR